MDGEQPGPFAQGPDVRLCLGFGAAAKADREPNPRDDFANPGPEPPDDRFGAELSVIPENVEQLVERASHRTARQGDVSKLMRDRKASAPGIAAHIVGQRELKFVEKCVAERLDRRIVAKAALLKDPRVLDIDERADRVIGQADSRLAARQQTAQIAGCDEVEIEIANVADQPTILRDGLGAVRRRPPVGTFPEVEMRGGRCHSRDVSYSPTNTSGGDQLFPSGPNSDNCSAELGRLHPELVSGGWKVPKPVDRLPAMTR